MAIWNTELIATSTRRARGCRSARSFQIRTMAMHRASPTMIRPVRSSGRSARNTQARVNMSSGPTTQFRSSETPKVRRSASSSPMCE